MTTRSLTQRIGSDHVILRDDYLVVLSRAYMEAWQVRTHRPTVISFNGRRWRVIEACAVAPGAIQYTLVPCDPVEQGVAGATIEYGLAFVAERDRLAGRTA